MAAGFTSTVMPAETKVEAAVVEEDQVRYEHVKKKGSHLKIGKQKSNYQKKEEKKNVSIVKFHFLFNNLCFQVT